MPYYAVMKLVIKDLLVRTFITNVRSLVEYNSVVWWPHMKKDTEVVEKVQKRFTKKLLGLYAQKLKLLT